jgi:hypothetical protein
MLRPTVSRPVCLGIKHPSGAYDQFFITVKQLWVCWCGALSLTRDGSVICNCCCFTPRQSFSGPSPVRIAAVFYCLKIRDLFFRRLLWVAGLRWRYTTPPPHGNLTELYWWMNSLLQWPPPQTDNCYSSVVTGRSLVIFVAAGTRASEPLPSKWTSTSVRCYSGFQAVFTKPLSSKWPYSSQYILAVGFQPTISVIRY